MSLKEWKDKELNGLLMKKWGFLKEDSRGRQDRNLTRNIRNDEKHIDDLDKDVGDDKRELDEGHDGPCGHGCGCPDAEDSEIVEGGMSYRDDDAAEESGLGKETETNPGDFTGTRGSEKEAVSALKQRKGLEENRSGKISVREAKEITRRIMARVRKEGK